MRTGNPFQGGIGSFIASIFSFLSNQTELAQINNQTISDSEESRFTLPGSGLPPMTFSEFLEYFGPALSYGMAIPGGFRSKALLDYHYNKHVTKLGEFGNITKEQYLERAKKLTESKPGGNILMKIRPNGDKIYYNKVTNELAVKASDGNIKTYFKPTDGIKYFNKQ
jgi:hypothetical protein